MGAQSVTLGARVQSLWGGYGEIRRVELSGSNTEHAILKHVLPPAERELRGDEQKLRSHRRKLRSYAVEHAFYRHFAERTDEACRVPALLHAEADANGFLFLFEDLDEAGFPGRRTHSNDAEITACLHWLAAFHARFMGIVPEGLWKVGSYWHLATRPDELAALGGHALQRAAARIDERLSSARFRTLVHGDAKLENFCFSKTGDAVAALDFQYVGGGVGVKDVAYFLGSCVSPRACASDVPRWLAVYFSALRGELGRGQAANLDPSALEAEWRELFPWAWVDFQRFLLGWAPSYAQNASNDRYSEQLTADVLALLR